MGASPGGRGMGPKASLWSLGSLKTPGSCLKTWGGGYLKAYASAAGPGGFVITGGKYLGGSGTKMFSQSQKLMPNTTKMEALGLSGWVLWPTGDILWSAGDPGGSQGQFFEPK